MECKCNLNDEGEVTSFCGAHYHAHRKILDPLEHKLALIKNYATKEHPLVSSRACPLCTWDWKQDEKTGWAMGTNRKQCSYHMALHNLYICKIEDT